MVIFLIALISMNALLGPELCQASDDNRLNEKQTKCLEKAATNILAPAKTCETLIDFYASLTKIKVTKIDATKENYGLEDSCRLNINGENLPLQPHPHDVLLALGFEYVSRPYDADGPSGSLRSFSKNNFHCVVDDMTSGITCDDCEEETPASMEANIICGVLKGYIP